MSGFRVQRFRVFETPFKRAYITKKLKKQNELNKT
jgi:hypothetical protein